MLNLNLNGLLQLCVLCLVVVAVLFLLGVV